MKQCFHLWLGFHVTMTNSGFRQNYVTIRLVTQFWSIRKKYQPRVWFLPSTSLREEDKGTCMCSLFMHCGKYLRTGKVPKASLKKGWVGKGLIISKVEFSMYSLATSPHPALHLIWSKGEMARNHPLCLHAQQGHFPPSILPLSYLHSPIKTCLPSGWALEEQWGWPYFEPFAIFL